MFDFNLKSLFSCCKDIKVNWLLDLNVLKCINYCGV